MLVVAHPPSVGNPYCGLVLVVAADPLGPSAPPSVGNPYCGLVQGVHDYVAIYGVIDILTLCCAFRIGQYRDVLQRRDIVHDLVTNLIIRQSPISQIDYGWNQ